MFIHVNGSLGKFGEHLGNVGMVCGYKARHLVGYKWNIDGYIMG